MKVEYLFSHNQKIGSRLISWASGFEKCVLNQAISLGFDPNNIPSHAAVLLNAEMVVESTLATGIRIIPYKKWKEHATEVARIPSPYQPSEDVTSHLLDLWGLKYDYKGLMYFGFCLARLAITDKPMPCSNKWEQEDRYFCTEFVAKLTGIDAAMMTPLRMMVEIMTQDIKNRTA